MGVEKDFQKHFENFLGNVHKYEKYSNNDITDKDYYFIESDIIDYIKKRQPYDYRILENNYGDDATGEIIRALKEELDRKPLWIIFRHGLVVREIKFDLFDRIPRSSESKENPLNNKISFIPQLIINDEEKPDIVIFLNGLPIIVIELKHEKNQNIHDAVKQFNDRNHDDLIFRLPFLYIASDTSEVKVATDPSGEEKFLWYNEGLFNKAHNKGEYPVEYLYRSVLSRENILNIISFYLIHVSNKNTDNIDPYTIFPRYHQSRMVENVCSNLVEFYKDNGFCGRKYLVNHSAGSGKTLSICWLADRLNSLYLAGTDKKIIDIVFILTDRKALDKNIKDDMVKFTHLDGKVKYAIKSGDLPRFVRKRIPIIVTTMQKINWILDELKNEPSLKEINTAFLIDEAHRSQDGSSGTNIRNLFKEDEPDIPFREEDEEDIVNGEIEKAHLPNLMCVAFTATPVKSTLQLFGTPFDVYSESEAIQEGYILDVASSIISYKTLYNLESRIINRKDRKLFQPGILSKMLKNVAYQDKGLIQYKAELMLRIFIEDVYNLIDKKAKAMIVTSSRIAGLFYYEVFKEKLKEKREINPDLYDFDVLYAFSDFTHPETGKDITEKGKNFLQQNELIEDLFNTDRYRLLVVADKFQTGFDQPLLAAMFLDKPVSDKNAVQTVSRLNRCHENKDKVVVVDFTNNASEIIKAFKKYRDSTPYEPVEPDYEKLDELYNEIISYSIFNQQTAEATIAILKKNSDAEIQSCIQELRMLFFSRIKDFESGKEYVNKLSRFNKLAVFLSNFFTIEHDKDIFSDFCMLVYPQLFKKGGESELKKIIKNIYVSRGLVKYTGIKKLKGKYKKKKGCGVSEFPPIEKVTIKEMLDDIKEKYSISEKEAIVIREVCEEKMNDDTIKKIIINNLHDTSYLFNHYKRDIRDSIENSYEKRKLSACLIDEKYTDKGSIFDIMSHTVIKLTADECA